MRADRLLVDWLGQQPPDTLLIHSRYTSDINKFQIQTRYTTDTLQIHSRYCITHCQGALLGYFALLFGVNACRNNGFGIVLTFALTGLLGYSLGPILNFYIKALKVIQALSYLDDDISLA